MRPKFLTITLLSALLATTLTAQTPPAGSDRPAGASQGQGDKDKAKPQDDKKAEDKKADAAEAAWLTSYEDALKRAKKEKKVVLADFTGSDWCHWCVKLKEEVFAKPEFQKWAKDNVILLEVDFPRQKQLPKELKEQNDKLAKEFKIEGYPTILFLSADGKKAGQMGYQPGGPEKWCKDAEKLVKKAKGK